ncbi:hypothetical protein F8154_04885 [Alkaliphilus pronyensis]|uniref:Uncharacterized protein n=1 Tax=Alkaliphilus pronyensis TaxID=1482732 RepID=A0A6I0FAM2_9FIRM|nr:hypothetical protein [Alkaliphilus pronyensis]KAB3535854.1 hypothetical protein F8154_04885 [Alkaliphilus pronyensis]
MSVKPIDFHLTYANTVRESRDKQNDFHRHKDINHYNENKLEAEVNKNLQKTKNTEEAQHKAINQRNKEEKSKGRQQEKKRKRQKSEIKKQLDKDSGIGQKLDIMI